MSQHPLSAAKLQEIRELAAGWAFSPWGAVRPRQTPNSGPAVLWRSAGAAARRGSFPAPAFALHLGGVATSPRHVGRVAGEIGDELVRQRDAKVAQRRQLSP